MEMEIPIKFHKLAIVYFDYLLIPILNTYVAPIQSSPPKWFLAVSNENKPKKKNNGYRNATDHHPKPKLLEISNSFSSTNGTLTQINNHKDK